MNKPTRQRTKDARVRQTRAAILSSFKERVLDESFDTIDVSSLAQDAGVGRSTLYEHFRNKDDVLLESMRPMLDVLVEIVSNGGDERRVLGLMDHLWENRMRARAMLRSETVDVIARELSSLTAARLCDTRWVGGWSLPVPIMAASMAESQITLIRLWLEVGGTDARTIARHLQGMTVAMRDTWRSQNSTAS